jgi:hypothetical protein
MDYELIFYLCGGALTVSAVSVSLLGLRLKDFPGRLAPVVALWFVALIGMTTTFAVLHSQHEERHHEEEVGLPHATERAEEEENQ